MQGSRLLGDETGPWEATLSPRPVLTLSADPEQSSWRRFKIWENEIVD